jgi:hypothetical protein
MKLLKPASKGLQIEVLPEELSILDGALERGIEDVEAYLKHGNPEDDYEGDAAGLAYVRKLPDVYLKMRLRIRRLLSLNETSRHYTVVLIYPDYLATQYGEEYYIQQVIATDPMKAVKKVQEEAIAANSEYYGDNKLVQAGVAAYSDDFAMVTVLEGECAVVL